MDTGTIIENTNLIESLTKYVGLVNILLITAYMIFSGLKIICTKRNKHEKKMILSKRVVKTSDGTEEYILTENDHIKFLTEENELLKKEVILLNGQHRKVSIVLILLAIALRFSKVKPKDSFLE